MAGFTYENSKHTHVATENTAGLKNPHARIVRTKCYCYLAMHVSVEKYNCVPRPRPSKAGGHALYVVKLKTTSPSAYRYSWSVAYACGNQRRAGHTIQWRDGETTLGVASSLICLCGSISPHRVSHTRVLIRPCVNFGLDFFQTKFTRSLRLTFQKKNLFTCLRCV